MRSKRLKNIELNMIPVIFLEDRRRKKGVYGKLRQCGRDSTTLVVAPRRGRSPSIDPRRDILRRQVERGSSGIDGRIVDNQSFRHSDEFIRQNLANPSLWEILAVSRVPHNLEETSISIAGDR